jgi:predicted DsbA family dithiol-disulfide isomerase
MSSRREALRIISLAGSAVASLRVGSALFGALAIGCRENQAPDGGSGRENLEDRDDASPPSPPVGTSPAEGTADGAGSGVDASSKEVVVKVELTHDVICPWCRIGHHRLQQAIAVAGRGVEISYLPFLLDPDVPPEGADLRQRLADKYGADALAGMFERVTQIGRADGITFDFPKIIRTPNTIAAHALLEAAPAAAKSALLERLHAAYFEHGDDIGARSVLLVHWEAAGLARADGDKALDDAALIERVKSEAVMQARGGVRGVPFFRIGATTVSGAQPVAVLVSALQKA